jgi:hypothetical protein
MSGIRVCLTSGDRSAWLALPSGPEDASAVFREIGAEDGGVQITACEAGCGGKLDDMIIGGDLNAVNYLAARLDSLSPDDVNLLEAMLESPIRADVLYNIARLIDFADNTSVYDLTPGIAGPEDLARHYIHHSGLIQMPPEWAEGIDLEKFGKNLEKHEPGFYTSRGFLIETTIEWNPVFEGGGIPAAYRIMPK